MAKTKPPYPEVFKQQIVELHVAGRTSGDRMRDSAVARRARLSTTSTRRRVTGGSGSGHLRLG